MDKTQIFNADRYAEQTFKAANALFDYPNAGLVPEKAKLLEKLQKMHLRQHSRKWMKK